MGYVNKFITIMALLVTCYHYGHSQGQRSTVSGKVLTSDGQPLAYASVLIKDTQYGTMAAADGSFKFFVPSGHHTVIVSYAGYVASQKPIVVISGQSVDLGVLTVDAPSNKLREVVVSDIQQNKFARKETDGVARMPLANLENPQVYSVITKELVQELAAIDYNSALTQIPGVVVMNGVNDSGNDVLLRGFRSSTSMRNGLTSFPRTQSEIFNLERVEVLKGPSATLFGGAMTSYGGVVNNVTKRPFESFRGEVGYSTGSWGLNRLTLDLNTPLNKDHTALMRINAMGHTQNGFQDAGRQQGIAVAASLLFKPNERTTVRLDADVYSPEKTLLAYVRNTQVLSYGSMDKVPLPYYRSMLSDDITTKRSNINVAAELEYKLSDHWTSRTSYQHNTSGDRESIFFVPLYVNDNQIRRQFRIFDDYRDIYDNLQQNFTGDYQIGGVKNQLVAGLDFLTNKTTNLSMNPVFQVFDVVGVTDEAWVPITRADIDKYRAERSYGDTRDVTGFETYSAYFSNVTNVSDRFFVMLSLRGDRYFEKDAYSFKPGAAETVDGAGNTVPAVPPSANIASGYAQTAFSPKFGLVYQPIKDQLSIFASYLNSFQNMASSMGISSADNLTETPVITQWKPEQANQYEAGVKMELLGGKINSTVSYYHIKVANRLREVLDGVSVQDGTQISKGFEWDFIANPVAGWNIILGYGYNDNEYVKDVDGTAGKRAAWTPEHVANAWTSYKILNGRAEGLGLGVGVNYVDKVYLDINEKFAVPAYTVLNATAFYDQPKYRVGLKFNNLADRHYWDFFGKPQKPFEFLANLSFKF